MRIKRLAETYLPLVIVVFAIVAVVLQLPAIALQRDAQDDRQTSKDISEIRNAISSYARDKHAMPKTLSAVTLDDGHAKDNLGAYTYKNDDTNQKYELCANFKTNTLGSEDSDTTFGLSSSSYANPSKHEKGNYCFAFDQPASASYDSQLFYQPPSDSGSVQSKAKDTEMQTDIRSLYSQLEAYYNSNSQYPSATQLYSDTWRQTNLKNLSSAAVLSPNGKKIGTAGGYVYRTSPGSCNGGTIKCEGYTLSGKRQNGTTYYKYSLQY
jgi:type II secretory pathway pseudopilin PulG